MKEVVPLCAYNKTSSDVDVAHVAFDELSTEDVRPQVAFEASYLDTVKRCVFPVHLSVFELGQT